jgi:hypothetical protein
LQLRVLVMLANNYTTSASATAMVDSDALHAWHCMPACHHDLRLECQSRCRYVCSIAAVIAALAVARAVAVAALAAAPGSGQQS